MDSTRDTFLRQVRSTLKAGNRPGAAADVPARGRIGYQGAGDNPVACFRDQLNALGGHAHVVADREAALVKVLELVQGRSARSVLLGRGRVIDSLPLAERLPTLGVNVLVVDGLSAQTCREPMFGADIGISGVDYLVAETGSVAVLARPAEPRSVSLLPPVHIAVAERSQILPDLFDLFERLPPEMPSCLSLITGPSKTGDIELRLVTGVHGPGEIHVVVIES